MKRLCARVAVFSIAALSYSADVYANNVQYSLRPITATAVSAEESSALDRLIKKDPALLEKLVLLDRLKIDRIIDGDTFVYEGERVRLVGFNSEEMGQKAKNKEGLEYDLGVEDRERTRKRLYEPDAIGAFVEDERDRYGRLLWNVVLVYFEDSYKLETQWNNDNNEKHIKSYRLLSTDKILNEEANAYAHWKSSFPEIRAINLEAGKEVRTRGIIAEYEQQNQQFWKTEAKDSKFKNKWSGIDKKKGKSRKKKR